MCIPHHRTVTLHRIANHFDFGYLVSRVMATDMTDSIYMRCESAPRHATSSRTVQRLESLGCRHDESVFTSRRKPSLTPRQLKVKPAFSAPPAPFLQNDSTPDRAPVSRMSRHTFRCQYGTPRSLSSVADGRSRGSRAQVCIGITASDKLLRQPAYLGGETSRPNCARSCS